MSKVTKLILYFQPPWSRIGPYAVGIIGGYLLDNFRRYPSGVRQLKGVFLVIFWLFTFGLLSSVIFGKIELERNPTYWYHSVADKESVEKFKIIFEFFKIIY